MQSRNRTRETPGFSPGNALYTVSKTSHTLVFTKQQPRRKDSRNMNAQLIKTVGLLFLFFAAANITTAPPAQAGEWVHCADEGEYCTVPGTARVRYGHAPFNKFNYLENQSGQVVCANAIFNDRDTRIAKNLRLLLADVGLEALCRRRRSVCVSGRNKKGSLRRRGQIQHHRDYRRSHLRERKLPGPSPWCSQGLLRWNARIGVSLRT